MLQGRFENQKALIDYAEAHNLAYAWEGSSGFGKRWHLAQLAQPGQYELVEVQTKRGIAKALLFPKAKGKAPAGGPTVARLRTRRG
jgi:hypothetical protein